jgi:hypothetical protein
MYKQTFSLVLIGVLALGAATAAGCTDDSASSSSSGNPFNPNTSSSSGSSTTDGGVPADDSGTGCSNKPAGCFCGTPTTQQQWLNRCTNAAALPVNLTVKPATTADIP